MRRIGLAWIGGIFGLAVLILLVDQGFYSEPGMGAASPLAVNGQQGEDADVGEASLLPVDRGSRNREILGAEADGQSLLDGQWLLQVSVVDEIGQALSGATVSIHDGQRELAGGRTNDGGHVPFALGEYSDELTVLASSLGYASEVTSVDPEVDEGVQVVLFPGGEIGGRVVFPDGRPRPGVVVMAESFAGGLPRSTGFSAEALLYARATRVEADDVGEFVLRGLRVDTVYRLSAYHDGWSSTADSSTRYCVCGDTDVEVVMTPRLGVRVCFDADYGESPIADLMEFGRRKIMHSQGLRPVHASAHASYVEDLSSSGGAVGCMAGSGRLILFEKTGLDEEAPSEVEIEYAVPGLGVARSGVVRLGDGWRDPYPIARLVFDRPIPELGSLRFVLDSSEYPGTFEWDVRGTLALTREDSGGVVRLPVRAKASDPSGVTLPCPVGEYRAEFMPYIGKVPYQLEPRGAVSVRGGELCDVTLRLSGDFGFIQLNVARPGIGRVIGAGARVALMIPGRPDLAKWVMPYRFSGDRAVVGPLLPATYSVEISTPFGSSEGFRDVEVIAGKLVDEWFVLDR